MPVYIYTTAISEFFFGKTAFAVRFPSVIAGFLSILVFIQLLRITTKSNKLALLAGLMVAISPWHLQFTRAGFEVSIALFLTLFGVFLIMQDFLRLRKTYFWGVSALVFSLYSYHFSRIISPTLIFFLSILYKKDFFTILKRKYAKIIIGILIILTLPFAFYAFSQAGLVRAQGESFLRDLPKEYKAQNELLNRDIWIVERLIHNYLTYFSIDFLFFSGDSIGRHSVREMGMLYLWQLPIYIFGMIEVIKHLRTNKTHQLFFMWFLIAPLAATLATPNPHALRGLPGLLPLTYIIMIGFFYIYRWISSKKIFLLTSASCIGYWLMLYLHIYYVHYAVRASPDWNSGYKEAILYILDQEKNYDQIQFSYKMEHAYMFLLFYSNFDPAKIQKLTAPALQIGKYVFYQSAHDITDRKILYVAHPIESFPGKIKEKILNAGGDSAFNIWEN